MKSNIKVRELTQTLSVKRNKTIYNKWYILPKLRYKTKSDNPKENPSILNDDEYLYKNLRNS